MAYIICNHRKSKPRLSIIVCGECKRMKKCNDYMSYIKPSLFGDSSKINAIKGLKDKTLHKQKKIRTENNEISPQLKQLPLNLNK
jgi:hypothetical protein